jgi:hypothetical protein
LNVQPDFRDLLSALNAHGVEYVIVGAFALAHHGRPRATGDLDVWVRPKADNAAKLLKALAGFGFSSVGLTEKDVLSGQVIQLGYPPVRIDLLTILDGVSADDIWRTKLPGAFGDVPAFFMSRRCLVENKRATGRPQDIADLESLGE